MRSLCLAVALLIFWAKALDPDPPAVADTAGSPEVESAPNAAAPADAVARPSEPSVLAAPEEPASVTGNASSPEEPLPPPVSAAASASAGSTEAESTPNPAAPADRGTHPSESSALPAPEEAAQPLAEEPPPPSVLAAANASPDALSASCPHRPRPDDRFAVAEAQGAVVEAVQRHSASELRCALDQARQWNVDASLTAPFVPLPLSSAKSPGNVSVGDKALVAESVNLVAALAVRGWILGLVEVFAWNRTLPGNSRLPLDVDGRKSTPLLHAVHAGHAGAVKLLLDAGAPPMGTGSASSETPLEAAAAMADSAILRLLLHPGGPYAYGMLDLRVRIRQKAKGLPSAVDRWPLGPFVDDGMDFMRDTLPLFMKPTDESVFRYVGRKPSNLVMLYYNRVMCALNHAGWQSTSQPEREAEAKHHPGASSPEAAAVMLSDHGYATFANEFSLSMCCLAVVVGAAYCMCSGAHRIRVYGGLHAPIALTPLVHGAFDPVELASPSFDVVRQRGRMQYLKVKPAPSQSIFSGFRVQTFFASFFCVHSSWLFMYVRIPPEKDVYDEDYQSDDDAHVRLAVRARAVRLVRFIRLVEIVVRLIALALALWWLLACVWLPNMATILLLSHSARAVVASVNGAGLTIYEREGQENSEAASNGSAALLTDAIFGVQYGPRWTRTISTTRSTASPKRKSHSTRRSVKDDRSCSDYSDEIDSALGFASGAPLFGTGSRAAVQADRDSYGYSFRRSALQLGYLHITQRSYMMRSFIFNFTCGVLALWFLHLGWSVGGYEKPWGRYYGQFDAVDLFRVYGAPGSWRRWRAFACELLVMGLLLESLGSVCCTLNVAGLALSQRRRALQLAVQRQPPRFAGETNAGGRVAEAARCVEFAVALSELRWTVLRGSVCLIFFWVAKLYVTLAVVVAEQRWCLSQWLPLAQARLVASTAAQRVDPVALLLIGLVFAMPLLVLCLEACMHNQELSRYVSKLEADGDLPRSSGGTGGEHDAVDKRAFTACRVRWPFGRAIGAMEPVVLVSLGSAVCVLVVCNYVAPK